MSTRDKILGTVLTLSSVAMPARAQTVQPARALDVPQAQSSRLQDVPPQPSIIFPTDQLPTPSLPALTVPLPQTPFSLDGLTLRFDRDELKRRIKTFEGKILTPYKDRVHITTIGYGFNMEKSEFNHPEGQQYFNGKYPFDPSGEHIWAYAKIPENFQDVLESARSKSVAGRLKISPESAEALLEASIDQAIHNAAAYFRHFNDMTAKQQMGAVYMTFNMGTNLENHPDLLDAANSEAALDLKKMHDTLIAMGYRHTVGAKSVLAAFTPPPEHVAARSHSRKHRTAAQYAKDVAYNGAER